MEQYEETIGEIPLDSGKKPKRKRRWWLIAINSVLGLVLLGVLAVAANYVYLDVRYDEAFFVSGMSMFPTLNGNAFRVEEGENKPIPWDQRYSLEGDVVDFGWCLYTEKVISTLSRYDIVVTYFDSDFKSDGTLQDGASLKIKRVVGLPGETVTFFTTQTQIENRSELSTVEKSLFNEAWGLTVIDMGTSSQLTLENLYDVEDFPSSRSLSGSSSYSLTRADVTTWTLGEDEYFLMGDNRAHSTDSRTEGAVSSSSIYGKAEILTSMRRLEYKDGVLTPTFVYQYEKWPWQYVDL